MDFHPNNTNWNHFEGYTSSLADKDSPERGSSEQLSEDGPSASASDLAQPEPWEEPWGEEPWAEPDIWSRLGPPNHPSMPLPFAAGSASGNASGSASGNTSATNNLNASCDPRVPGKSGSAPETEEDEEDFMRSEPPSTWQSSLAEAFGKFVGVGRRASQEDARTDAKTDTKMGTESDAPSQLRPAPSPATHPPPLTYMNGTQVSYQSFPSSLDLSNSQGLRLIPAAIRRNKRLSSHETIKSFNAEIMPSKLIMVRHGESEGNLDELLYSRESDNSLRLTKLGWEMARMAGKALREQFQPGETVHFVVSPYVRTVETFHGIASAWCDPEDFNHIEPRNKRIKQWYLKLMEMGLTWHEDPRIREQDFGNYQDPEVIKKCKRERHKFGAFYYRFPHGESASDVFDRVSTFLDSLWRSFEYKRARNYVLVTHGIAIRVFLARYFRYSIDQFTMLANPKNCEMVILAHDGQGRLTLDGRCELELEEKKEEITGEGKDDKEKETKADEKENGGKEGEKEDEKEKDKKVGPMTRRVVVGYKKYSRLRTLPPHLIQVRAIRMCYNDTGS